MARYERFLSPAEAALLCNGGVLHFLISDYSNGTETDPDSFDIHFRENNKLMYYHGTTCVLTAALTPSTVKFTADKRYRGSKYAGNLFKLWQTNDAPEIRKELKSYLSGICREVADRYYANKKEGFWQNKLCIYYGPKWDESKKWLIIDRECVIGFNTGNDKKEFYEQKTKRYQSIKLKLQTANRKAWGTPEKKNFGDELDMLAISPAKGIDSYRAKTWRQYERYILGPAPGFGIS